MRKEVFSVGDYVHVYNRGNRKAPIVREASDKWHFLQMLYYFNSEIPIANPFREPAKTINPKVDHGFLWPNEWPFQKPIVYIIAFSLMENHFHLLLKEIKENGIELFMRKLGTGMAKHFNAKYQEVGGLFQGSYKAKVVEADEYLKYLSVYIQVKNPFELYPKGLKGALRNFDAAFKWAVNYPYCSLADYAEVRNSPLIKKDILAEMFCGSKEYKQFAQECMQSLKLEDKLGPLAIDR